MTLRICYTCTLHNKQQTAATNVQNTKKRVYWQIELLVPDWIKFSWHCFGSLLSLSNLNGDVRVARSSFVLRNQSLRTDNCNRIECIENFRSTKHRKIAQTRKLTQILFNHSTKCLLLYCCKVFLVILCKQTRNISAMLNCTKTQLWEQHQSPGKALKGVKKPHFLKSS